MISLCHEGKGIDAGENLLKKLKTWKYNELHDIVE